MNRHNRHDLVQIPVSVDLKVTCDRRRSTCSFCIKGRKGTDYDGKGNEAAKRHIGFQKSRFVISLELL